MARPGLHLEVLEGGVKGPVMVPRRRRLRYLTFAFPLVALVLVGPLVTEDRRALPLYGLALQGDFVEREAVNGGVAATTIARGVPLEVVLYPREPTTLTADMAAFWSSDRRLQPWDVSVRRLDGGAVRLVGMLGDDVAEGTESVTLLVLLAPKGALPADGFAVAQQVSQTVFEARALPSGWQLRRHVCRVVMP